MKKHTRQYMIDSLVGFSLSAALQDPDAEWLREIFANGFVGFSNMSDRELLREMQFRDLAGYPGGPEAIEDAEPEEEDDDHALQALLPFRQSEMLPE
jgi:hypothetical protein